MSQFTTRVELHGANWQDYEVLHSRMAAEGFSRTITSDQGDVYELPTAEYDLVGPFTQAQVVAKADRAAAFTGKSRGILVTEAVGRTWRGLKMIRAAQRQA